MPIVIVGGLFADVIEARLRSPLVVAVDAGDRRHRPARRPSGSARKTRDARSLGYGEALAIGIAQAAALVPGVSRSGATLTLALLLGLRRERRRGSCFC